MSTAASTYDQLPYQTRPRYSTHPDCLALFATLAGLHPTPIEHCRTLELGCGPGGSLLPLADGFPHSQFVGIDLSARQIEMGQETVRALGLTNLRLEAKSILEIDESLGRFDYIVAHGVYSWVPAEIRDAVLRVCGRHLTPNGVAMISYNTQPGWHGRGPVGDMMRFHAGAAADAQGRVKGARKMLHFLRTSLPPTDSTWTRLVGEETTRLAKEPDFYLQHEYLDGPEHAVYFHEFAAHARQHGLHYLAEASNQDAYAGVPPDARKAIEAMTDDPITREQYGDFLTCRHFRRTLLVPAETALPPTCDPGVVEKLRLVGMARPADPHANVCSNDPLPFRGEGEIAATTNIPPLKAALMVLFEASPEALSYEQVWQRTRMRLAAGGIDLPDDARLGVAGAFLQLFRSGLVGLHTGVAPFVIQAGERPHASPLALRQARTGVPVVGRRHCVVELADFDRAVLGLLDGTRDRPALVQALVELVQHCGFQVARQGIPLTSSAELEILFRSELEGALHRLARSALLVS